MALAFDTAVNCTNAPFVPSRTHCRPDASEETTLRVYDGPRTVPVLVMFSASYVVHGTVAPLKARAEFAAMTRVRILARLSILAFMSVFGSLTLQLPS